CCKNRSSSQARSCCGHKSAKPGSTPLNGLMAKSGSGCQPIVEAPAPAAASKKAELGSELKLVAATLFVAPLAVPVDARPSLDRSSFSTPPPLDAVIVFQHLTI